MHMRLHVCDLQLTSNDRTGPWFLLQTNDDANKFPLDHRRPMTATILAMLLASSGEGEKHIGHGKIRSDMLAFSSRQRLQSPMVFS
jgi:hypothetical protein